MKVLWQSSGYHTCEKATWTLNNNSARIWPAPQEAKLARTTSLFTAAKMHVTNAICGKTFTATKGTPFYRLHHPADWMVIVVTLIAHGCPLQAIVAAFHLDERTVTDWQERSGRHCQQVHEHLVKQPRDLEHVQGDEIRVKGQGKVVWLAMAIMVSTRLWLGGVVSTRREEHLILSLVQIIRTCALARPLLICTDGFKAYVQAIQLAFRSPLPNGKRGKPRLISWSDVHIGLAVDLLSRQGGIAAFGSEDVPGALGNTPPEQFVQDFISAWRYLQGQSFADAARAGMVGFCFGGGVTWQVAVGMPELRAAVPFYGPHPAVEDVPKIQAPVLAIYGGLDERINSGIPAIEEAMKQNNKVYEKVIYPNAGHAFHNDTGPRYNPEAAQDAWKRTLEWFGKYLS